jgi:hypothetical protein
MSNRALAWLLLLFPTSTFNGQSMNTQKHYRRMDDVSIEEVKDFWFGFCMRKGVDPAIRAKGEARIERDPDYWADQTMPRLLDTISLPN